ncbi:MAG: tetratricopeptide repeat protein [Bacteroidota bacterium]
MQKLLTFLLLLVSSMLWSQSSDLAENYMDQGEYEKANSVYQKLYERQPRSQKYLLGLAQSYVELEQIDKAIQLLEDYLGGTDKYPNINVELGQLYKRQNNEQKAQTEFNKAIEKAKTESRYAYAVGSAFQKNSLLDEAVQVYENAEAENPKINYKIQLAKIYGEKGNLSQMFSKYIDLIQSNPNYYNVVSRNFNEYISPDKDNEANQVLRKILLKELQKNPDVLYNQLLSWLFVQQKEYDKSFTQEKAILKRSETPRFNRLQDLAEVAIENEDYLVAEEVYRYIIEETKEERVELKTVESLLQMLSNSTSSENYSNLKKEFEKHLSTYGKTAQTAGLQLIYADFLAFQLEDKEAAKTLLKALLAEVNNRFLEARTKMLLADIYVLEERFNQALLFYTQIEKLLKNNELAQESRFKVAKTSYYKGDFDWALTQLDVLKKATSQQIANDAMELARHIKDNSFQDSIQTALKKVAKADLLTFQKNPDEALQIFEAVIAEFEQEPIADEVLYRMAKIYEEKGDYEAAIEAYKQIVKYHGDDILADNAFFALGAIYENQLDDPQKAQEYYEQIIFNFQDSIYFVAAQKSYRKLRGDFQHNQ